jgi:hypothetical protein
MTMSVDADTLFLGPEFDLSLQLGPVGNDARVSAAVEAVWTYLAVAGPWPVSSRIGKTKPLYPDPSGRILQRSRFGLLTVDASEPALPFVLRLIRDRSDWLTLGIPITALRSLYPLDESWIVAKQPWLGPLSQILAGVADHVHRRESILMGVVGEEASGCWRSPTLESGGDPRPDPDYPPIAILTADVIDHRGGFVVSPELWRELDPKSDAVAMPSGLLYVPPQPGAALTGQGNRISE